MGSNKVCWTATATCPTCKADVQIVGEGRQGEKVRAEGYCPSGHLVFAEQVIR